MPRKKIIGIIFLLAISLIGIIFFQVYWLRTAITVKEERFNQSVNEALSLLSEKIQHRDVYSFLSDSIRLKSSVSIIDTCQAFPIKKEEASVQNTKMVKCIVEDSSALNGKVAEVNDIVQLIFDSTNKISVDYNDELGKNDAVNSDNQVFVSDLDFSKIFDGLWIPEIGGILDTFFQAYNGTNHPGITDSSGFIIYKRPGVRIVINNQDAEEPVSKARVKEETKKKGKQIQNAISQMVVEYSTLEKPIDERLNQLWLDSVLKAGFQDKGIAIPFEFAVAAGKSDSLTNLRSAGFKRTNPAETYKSSLFPENVFVSPDYLLIYFPEKNMHIYKSLAWVFAGSLLLVLVVISALGGSVWALLRQKRMADIKSDFINNMTHEFKTPIATISLAADSINNPRVIDDPEQIRHFSRIIKEENQRMNSQVENVLQMALLDRELFKLQKEIIDIHEVLREAINKTELLIANRQGSLVVNLSAGKSVAEADGIQLLAVFMNIIDNAIKYSPNELSLNIETRNRANYMSISISDKGMGMNRDQQKYIFEKFFRVSTGNVHNVKGFGLGLSFAHAIVLLHKGDIRVESEPDRGSTFEITLPLINGNL